MISPGLMKIQREENTSHLPIIDDKMRIDDIYQRLCQKQNASEQYRWVFYSEITSASDSHHSRTIRYPLIAD